MMQVESKCDQLPECRRYLTLPFDEMNVNEDIVYDKASGDIIGFCNLESLNDELLQAERDTDAHPPIAKHILAVMIHGLLFKLEFPLAHFSTKIITADLLYPIFGRGLSSGKYGAESHCCPSRWSKS